MKKANFEDVIMDITSLRCNTPLIRMLCYDDTRVMLRWYACGINTILLTEIAAFKHIKAVGEIIQCQPRPFCLDIRRQFNTPNEDFVPACTVQHRCTPSTGCCNVTSYCGRQHSEPVPRFVFVSQHCGHVLCVKVAYACALWWTAMLWKCPNFLSTPGQDTISTISFISIKTQNC